MTSSSCDVIIMTLYGNISLINGPRMNTLAGATKLRVYCQDIVKLYCSSRHNKVDRSACYSDVMAVSISVQNSGKSAEYLYYTGTNQRYRPSTRSRENNLALGQLPAYSITVFARYRNRSPALSLESGEPIVAV